MRKAGAYQTQCPALEVAGIRPSEVPLRTAGYPQASISHPVEKVPAEPPGGKGKAPPANAAVSSPAARCPVAASPTPELLRSPYLGATVLIQRVTQMQTWIHDTTTAGLSDICVGFINS